MSFHHFNKKNIEYILKKDTLKKDQWLMKNLDKTTNFKNINHCKDFTIKLYNKGYSALDLMIAIKKNKNIDELKKYKLLIFFDNARSEFRDEKLLIFYILTIVFMRIKSNLENICEM